MTAGHDHQGEEPEPLQLSASIRYADVLHFLGYPERRRPPEKTEQLIRSLLAEARRRVSARGAYRYLPVEAASDVGLEPMPASSLVIGLVTVGGGIEQHASELADRGATTAALLLDAMGSAAVEEAADRLGACIADGKTPTLPDEAESAVDEDVPAVSCRISPGYGRWPLTSQTQLFERLPHAALDVRLLPSFLMVPRKSISFAMWMGADARPIAGLSGCDRCGLEHCRYRRGSRRS